MVAAPLIASPHLGEGGKVHAQEGFTSPIDIPVLRVGDFNESVSRPDTT